MHSYKSALFLVTVIALALPTCTHADEISAPPRYMPETHSGSAEEFTQPAETDALNEESRQDARSFASDNLTLTTWSDNVSTTRDVDNKVLAQEELKTSAEGHSLVGFVGNVSYTTQYNTSFEPNRWTTVIADAHGFTSVASESHVDGSLSSETHTRDGGFVTRTLTTDGTSIERVYDRPNGVMIAQSTLDPSGKLTVVTFDVSGRAQTRSFQ